MTKTTPLGAVWESAVADLEPHLAEFDAILCGGDFHGLALAAIVSAHFDKPLMAVCQSQDHGCTVQHTVVHGDITPSMRFLYIDDFFGYGRTLVTVFAYMNQVQRYKPDYPAARIVATYEATPRKYEPYLFTTDTTERIVCGNTVDLPERRAS